MLNSSLSKQYDIIKEWWIEWRIFHYFFEFSNKLNILGAYVDIKFWFNEITYLLMIRWQGSHSLFWKILFNINVIGILNWIELRILTIVLESFLLDYGRLLQKVFIRFNKANDTLFIFKSNIIFSFSIRFY